MHISYNWLKWYIPDAPPAEKLADLVTYHLAEVESVEKREDGDFILDIKILPNRAHDLLSHQGVAREVASLLNIQYVDPTPKYKIPESVPTKLQVEINTDKCRRDAARIVRNVKVGPSPEWVVKHLESIGQRSINNIVDATNIVMFDCGQPSHVFDMDKVKGPKLNINTSAGEKISFLGGTQKELQRGMVAIYDAEGNPIGTGVKGGTFAELDNNTKNIILQMDNFDPVAIRKMGQALNMFTEGRKRFENDLSPELIPYAMRELSALILEMCPEAIFEDIVDVYPKKQEERKLSFSTDRVSKILGLKVEDKEVEDILKRYNFKYRPLPNLPLNKGEEQGGGFEITVPPMRLDLAIEEDMAEEVVRILGYDRVKGNVPKINFEPKQNETYSKILWARNKLLTEGYSEVMTYSFCDKGEVEVQNSASDKKFLRTNLKDGLKDGLKLNNTNAPLLGLKEIKIFEIGTVFKKTGEEMHVGFGDKKNITEVSLSDFCKDMPSDFSLSTFNFQLSTRRFAPWSLFPFIARDVAVWVPASSDASQGGPEEVQSLQVEKIIKEGIGDPSSSAGKMIIRGPELFDEFKKDGKTSYAFRIVFQSYDRTLTDQEVNEIMVKITDKIKENNGWQVR